MLVVLCTYVLCTLNVNMGKKQNCWMFYFLQPNLLTRRVAWWIFLKKDIWDLPSRDTYASQILYFYCHVPFYILLLNSNVYKLMHPKKLLHLSFHFQKWHCWYLLHEKIPCFWISMVNNYFKSQWRQLIFGKTSLKMISLRVTSLCLH